MRVIWFCIRFVWSDQFDFMAFIMVSIVLICSVSSTMFGILWLFLIFFVAFFLL